MNYVKIIFSLLYSFTAFAEFREHEPHPRTCDQARLNACIQRYQEATTLVRSWITGLEPKLEALRAQEKMINKNFGSLDSEKRTMASEEKLLADELDFFRSSPPPKGEDIFPSHLSLEDYFQLHPLLREWGEFYPEERAKKLSGTLLDTQKKLAEINVRITRTEEEKSRLDSEIKSGVSQKNSWLAEIREHEGMCNGGCREQVCPTAL